MQILDMRERRGSAQLPVQGINQELIGRRPPKLMGALGVKHFSTLMLLLDLKPSELATSDANFSRRMQPELASWVSFSPRNHRR